VPRGQRDGSLRPYCRLARPGPLLFLPSSSSIVLTLFRKLNVVKFARTVIFCKICVMHNNLILKGIRKEWNKEEL
jgi:hypothetical protein